MKVSIAADATVTLDGVTIVGDDDENYKWAGLNCLGDATIILKDGTENEVSGFYQFYPGIHVPAGSRLTITGGTEGDGNLLALSNGYGAGIGGGNNIPCGNIDIQGGNIMARGGLYSAGIGGGSDGSCGNITISGGTVMAMGGREAAGIGSGHDGSCGAITITNGVTRVSATKGDEEAPYSIGAGKFTPDFVCSLAVNLPPLSVSRSASTVQYSTGLNAAISFSLSTSRRTVTDCTRPAERPLLTFFHRKGESL